MKGTGLLCRFMKTFHLSSCFFGHLQCSIEIRSQVFQPHSPLDPCDLNKSHDARGGKPGTPHQSLELKKSLKLEVKKKEVQLSLTSALTTIGDKISEFQEGDHTSKHSSYQYMFPQFYKLFILIYVPHPASPFQFFNSFTSI